MANCGYPLEWFAQPVDESLKCGICCQIMRCPTATKCGHIYCAQCISSWVGYYGVCPERCREVQMGSLKRRKHMDQLISGLAVYCKNKTAGCPVQVSLAEKQYHEQQVCRYRSSASSGLRKLLPKFSLSQQNLFTERKHKAHHKRTSSSGFSSRDLLHAVSKIKIQRSPSAAAFCNPAPMPVAMNSKGTYSVHTFRLKRNKSKEPLGLVLVSGEKTADGRPRSFHVKKVHPDTLGWRAGLQALDRIVQVDHHDLTSISPQEAVARIKEKPFVILTVHRGLGVNEHVYDEIFYSDSQLSQNNSQQDENMPLNVVSSYPKPRVRAVTTVEESQRYQNQHRQGVSSNGAPVSGAHHLKQPAHRALHPQAAFPQAAFPQGMERGSKDSGLSSGSSTHQDSEVNISRQGFAGKRESYHSYTGSQGSQGSHVSRGSHQVSNSHCRIEGNYEVEDIYLQKNGTSQLGITLGYDTKSTSGKLVICEILPSGLAAQNGCLKTGDIVRRVNGFEVHDPEEAVLLFLEQDQDITLTVARPVKQVASSHRLPSSSSNISHPTDGTGCSDREDRSYSRLDSSRASSVRRVDSCGSLDSQGQPSPSPVIGEVFYDQPIKNSTPQMGNEKMRRTKSASSTSKPHLRKDFLKSRSPPARQPSPLVTESQQTVYHVLQQPGSPPPAPEAEPVYHILQQPGSPQQLVSPTPTPTPIYEVLQEPPASRPAPVYHVLQKSGSPKETVDSAHPPLPVYQVLQQPGELVSPTHPQPVYQVLQQPDHSPTAFQHEECRPISSDSKTKGSKSSRHRHRKGSTHQQKQQQVQCRPASTPPHKNHHCLILDDRQPSPHNKTTPPHDFRSIANMIDRRCCETVPAESLV